MSIFKNLIINEISKYFVIILSTLIIIWFSVIIIRILNESILQEFTAIVFISVLYIITVLPILMSIALFISVVFTIARSYRDSEMIIWLSGGLSLTNLYSPILIISLIISALIMIFSIFFSPISYKKIDSIRSYYSKNHMFNNFSAGKFIELSSGKVIFFADNISENRLFNNVFIRFHDTDFTTLIISRLLEINNNLQDANLILMKDSVRLDINNKKNDKILSKFDEYSILFNKTGSSYKINNRKIFKGLPITVLFSENSAISWSHIFWRFSIPLIAINLSLLAIPLGAINSRINNSINFIIAGFICMIYINIVGFCQYAISEEYISVFLGFLFPHILVGLISFFLAKQSFNSDSFLRKIFNLL